MNKTELLISQKELDFKVICYPVALICCHKALVLMRA
ncbi:uncharacterized protein METZ01_LOCUS270619 [marine metagenome]|uniref:Uncharacterized protein n=1 Tax=marine metagenome TaxID=408172 RepID=A0A382K1R8_9ZZZZ